MKKTYTNINTMWKWSNQLYQDQALLILQGFLFHDKGKDKDNEKDKYKYKYSLKMEQSIVPNSSAILTWWHLFPAKIGLKVTDTNANTNIDTNEGRNGDTNTFANSWVAKSSMQGVVL